MCVHTLNTWCVSVPTELMWETKTDIGVCDSMPVGEYLFLLLF